MFELAQQICYPGNPKAANEDIAGFGKDYCFVMDGASCLSGIHVMEQGSDAAWMVNAVKQSLCQRLDSGDARPTRQILQEIIPPIRQEYESVLHSRGLHQPEDSPSAGLALFRQREGRLEFFGLGDCVGVAVFPEGNRFVSLDTNLVDLDNTVLEKMKRIHADTGMPILEAKTQCNDLLMANRQKRNRPGGYWVLDLFLDEGMQYAREFSWEMTGPVRVGTFSDGFAQLTELFDCYKGYGELFDAMQTTDLDTMFETLCRVQDSDPLCDRYPRFKLRDDTSALWGVFQ